MSATSRMHELDEDECWARLAQARPRVGRLGFVVDQHPMVLPVNYVVDGTTVVVRFSGDTIIDDAVSTRVVFEVDQVDADSETGWSVVVQGRAREVVEDDVIARLEDLPLRAWAATDRVLFLRIDARHGITGRSIR